VVYSSSFQKSFKDKKRMEGAAYLIKKTGINYSRVVKAMLVELLQPFAIPLFIHSSSSAQVHQTRAISFGFVDQVHDLNLFFIGEISTLFGSLFD
jgi:hypothetical protein